ncbi:MAG: FG-GAP-like repeat-containing protein, partial [bacterium]
MLRGKFFVGYSAVLIFCFSCLPLYAQLSVTKHTIDGNFNSAHWVYATDIDRDGDIDIAAASTAQGLKWYKNNGSGSFTKQSVGSFSGAWSVYAKDVDEDGDVDMLGASARLHEIGWWKNSGSESFTKKVVGSDFKSAESVFAADLDNDGDNDILGAAWEDGELAWWEKKGGDNFTKHILDGNYTNAHSIHAADLDGDGDFDIISCSATKTNWWRNDGNGSFTKKNLGSTGGLGVFAADLDSDGDMDILRTERSNDDIDWFENNGSGGFTLHTIQAAFGNSWSVVAGDVDGDGDRDVVAAAFIDNKISVWLNDGKENFSEVVIDDNLSGPRGVFAADFDADGDEDIAAAVNSDGDVVWYEVTGSPAPPPAVTVLDPNGGEMLEVNATHTIQWTSTGSVSDVDIEFSTDGGSSWNVIVSSAQNTGSFDWLVPDQPSDNALVRVSDATDANISDVSDGVFSIVNPAPAITVTQPNGGELWSIGTDQVITWTSAGVIDSVQLEFSIDGGLSWTIIAASVANDGNYTWTIPDAASDNCLVRISDATDGDPVDTSDAVFTITSELVYVQRVNAGGSEFTGGDGRVWDADQAFVDGAWGYVGGNTFSTTDAIANTTDDVLYQSERHTLTGYSFTVPSSGSYHVELHFAEIFLNEAGGRIFDVSIENALVLDNLDIYAEVGHDAALVKSFDVEVTDGVLDVTFAAVVEEPKISAIEVSITTTTTDSTAPVISNVVASSITSTSAAISWDTDEASDSQVEYGLDSSYGSTTGLDAALVTSHSVTLTGLSASTTYHYRVLSADGNGNLAASGDFTFTTTVAASYVQRVNAGGSAYTGGDGRVWDADQAFVDGAWGY